MSIKAVDIDFFKTIVLEDIYIEDQQRDTLLYAERLSTDIGLFSLLDKKIALDKVVLLGAKMNLSRYSGDTTFNIDPIIQYFQTEPTTTDTVPWAIGISEVILQKTQIHFLDELAATKMDAQITYLSIEANAIDFQKQIIDLAELTLQSAAIDYEITKANFVEVEENLAPDSLLVFPELGWDLSINKLDFLDNSFVFNNQNVPPKAIDGIDFEHLDLSNIIFLLNDFSWKKKSITGKIDRLGLVEKSGFDLQNIRANFIVDSTQIALQNLEIQTPFSRVDNTTTLRFKEFRDLADLTNKVYFKSHFNSLNIGFPDLKLFAPVIEDLRQLDIDLKEQLYLNGIIEGTLNDLNIKNLDFKIGNEIGLAVNAQLKNITNINTATFDIQLEKLATSYQNIEQLTHNLELPKGLAEFGQFNLSGHAFGQVNDFTLNDFLLQTASNTYLKGNAKLLGLPDAKKLQFDLVIDALETQSKDWKGFLQDTIPPILDSLGKVQFAGKVKGDVQNFELLGDLTTEIGQLESDLVLNFTSDYQSASYKGDLQLINFELNQAFPENDKLGATSLQVKGEGSGFVVDSIIANAAIIVDSIAYNNYTYRDIVIKGNFAQKDFDGYVKILEENVNLELEGKINLKDSIPDFSFVVNIDTLNLLPLNFTEKPLSFALDANIDFKGNSLDNIDGKSTISNFYIDNGEEIYTEDSIIFNASRPTLEQVVLSLQSDFLKAKIKGDFDIATLQQVTLNYIRDYFPIDNLLDAITREKIALASDKQQAFDFDIQIKDPTPLTLLFVPQLKQLEEAIIRGNFDRKNQQLEVEAIIDALHFGGLETEQLLFKINGTSKKLYTNLALLTVETGGLAAPLVIFDGILEADSLDFQVKVTGDTLDQRLTIKGMAYDAIQWYEIKLKEELILNGEPWKVAANNGIYFLNQYLFVDNLKIRDGRHQIAIQSEGYPNKIPTTPPLTLSFNDFEIADITNFLAINQNRVKGLINGNFTLNEPFGTPHYLADLQIDELTLNEEKIGQLYLNSEQLENSQIINLTAGLKGEKNNLNVAGKYDIDKQEYDIKGIVSALEMRLIDPFAQDIISKSVGQLSGDFTLTGTPKASDLKGQLNLKEVSTIIDFLGTGVLIPKHTIVFNNNNISLGRVDLKDVNGQKGAIMGNISHQFFTDFEFDLQFKSDAFQIMNTMAVQNPLFFGQLFVAATVNITGNLELPTIEVQAKTLTNSVFNLQPLIESEEIATDEYILFTDREKYLQQESDGTVVKYNLSNAFNLNLLMNLDITPDALLRVIIDPLTGDQMEGRGRSNMTISLAPSGEFRILGDFVIESGQYNFSYQNLVKKNFAIEPGSRVSFTGDPLKARFNIAAAYKLKTTTYELVKNEIDETSGEALAAKRRSDITALLYLNGLLTEPAITFDIQLDKSTGNEISSTVSRKLADLQNNQDEMNKQVFALLIFNSFIASENAGQSLAGAGQNVALSSVSKLLSNQLNKLATKYLKGLELNFDLASYQSNFEDTAGPTVEVGVGLSQKLFNDRITIKADADFNLANQSATASSGSNVAGNFILEYQLTEKGNYVLRVFRLSDFDIITDQNTDKTGVSINYRKAFGSVLKRKQQQSKKNSN